MKILITLLLATVCAAAGCGGGSLLPSLSYAAVLALEPKLSTQGDVLEHLGAPMHSDARTWCYESARFTKGASERRTLRIDFGTQLKVETYRWTFESAGASARKHTARSALKEYLELRFRRCSPETVARALGVPNLATPTGMLYKIQSPPGTTGKDVTDCRIVFVFDRTRFFSRSLYVNRTAPVLLETIEKDARVDDERAARERFGPPAMVADGTRWFWRLENGKLLNIDFDAKGASVKQSIVPVAVAREAAGKSILRFAGMKRLFRR